jgi:uncharacterized ion transporter superfamily protein YfcC
LKNNKVIDISKKTFIQVVLILFGLMILSVVLTYMVPAGRFAIGEGGIIDYNTFIPEEDASGIPIWKGLLSPVLLLFSDGAITVIMLSLFLLVVSGSFQIMNDTFGMKVIIETLIRRFQNRKKLLIAIIVLIFMIFGSFFGLFEETLTLLPLMIMLMIYLGYDSFSGFLICTVATGFGFASAVTNPFTVLVASEIIDASITTGMGYRVLIFVVMYALLLFFIFHYLSRLEKDSSISPSLVLDQSKKEMFVFHMEPVHNQKKIFLSYAIFLSTVFVSIVALSLIDSLRDYIIVFLIAIFLIGGILAGLYSTEGKFGLVLKSFGKGVLSALPAILIILMASSIKYILEEGHILPTITNFIKTSVEGQSPFLVVMILFLITLVLEFFVSSSTAKAAFVMGILKGTALGISNELLVLTYLFGDGYTNILFPTSPVLLLGLAMAGVEYGHWIKRSKWLFLAVLALTILFLLIATGIGY